MNPDEISELAAGAVAEIKDRGVALFCKDASIVELVIAALLRSALADGGEGEDEETSQHGRWLS